MAILKRFHYKAYDEDGLTREGDVLAASRDGAAREIRKLSLHPIRVEERKRGREPKVHPLSRKVLSLLAGEWAALLEAGLTMTDALTLLQQQAGKREQKVLAKMEASISGGGEVWESLQAGGRFPPFFVSLVKVGELTGTLPEQLRRLAAYYKKEEELREKMKRALAYPLFVICFALAVLFIILTFILPSFSLLFSALSVDMPPLSARALAFGLWLRDWGGVLGVGGLVLLLLLVVFLKSEKGKELGDHLLCRCTWYKRILLIRFCYTLAAFLESGKTLTASLEEVKVVLHHTDTDRALSYMISAITRGEPFGQALKASGFSLPVVEGLIHVGMESGELPYFLTQAAELLTGETERAFQRFRAVLEPCLLLFTGALTAFILFSVMLPVFHAASGAFLK